MQNDDDDDDDDDVSTLELEQSASISCRYYPTSYFNQSINPSINQSISQSMVYFVSQPKAGLTLLHMRPKSYA